MQQIQLPQGMKDTILNECEKKKYLQNTLEQIFESFGYEGVYKQVEEVFLSDIKQDYIVDASWAVSNTK